MTKKQDKQDEPSWITEAREALDKGPSKEGKRIFSTKRWREKAGTFLGQPKPKKK